MYIQKRLVMSIIGRKVLARKGQDKDSLFEVIILDKLLSSDKDFKRPNYHVYLVEEVETKNVFTIYPWQIKKINHEHLPISV